MAHQKKGSGRQSKRAFRGRTLRPVYYIIPEGDESEVNYLKYLQKKGWLKADINLSCKQPKARNIDKFLERAREYEERANEGNYIWIILDRDDETHMIPQLKELGKWQEEHENHRVALTTPRFEYWMLLHVGESHAEAAKHSPIHATLPNNYPNKYVLEDKALTYLKTRLTHVSTVRDAMSKCKNRPSCSKPDVIGSGMVELLEQILA